MNHKIFEFKKYLLLAGDIIILFMSLYLALTLRYGQLPDAKLWQAHFWPFSFIFAVWLLIFYISSLYDLTLATNNAKFHALTAQSLLINFLLGAAFFYLNPQINIAPKTNLLLIVAVTAVLFTCWRYVYNIILESYLPKNNVAIIGINEQARELIQRFHDYPHLGFNIVCIIYDQDIDEKGFYNIPIYKNIQDLKQIFKEKKISLAILAEDLQRSKDIRTQLFSTLALGINFMSVYHFYEKIMNKVPAKSLNQMWFLENINENSKLWYDKFKRTYDVFLAIFIFLISVIFWPLIALIIKMESDGPVFYRQNRLGKNNIIIKLYKFRTMHEEGNTRRPTVANDARVTSFGRLLRKTRVDELPQIINIIKGEMSFIGPRPERPEIAEQLQQIIPFYNERTLILPGVTGWDQICGEYHSPSIEDTIKKLQYDLFYIKNRSIFLDLIVMLRTIKTILTGNGV